MRVLSYGGGTNSTAIVVGLIERGLMVDDIIFADTGGEKPHTYEHIAFMNEWLPKHGFPTIQRVVAHQPSKFGSLERMCLENKRLPSVAYGFKSCSVQYKIEPFDKYIKENYRGSWDAGEIVKLIGIDAGEERRVRESGSKNYSNEFPLVEWGWDREDCVEAIKRHGLPQPLKSACFFCPSSKISEIKELAAMYPDLMDRALAIESNAENSSVKGLGRNFAWKDVIATDDMFLDSYIEVSCGCYDG